MTCHKDMRWYQVGYITSHDFLCYSLSHVSEIRLNISLINKHFPLTHKYRKIFNRNTIKISYSCIPNVKSNISTHNKKILNKPVNQNNRKCNCINKNTSPLNGNCLLENILYVATIKSEKKNYQPRNYRGISENIFKKTMRKPWKIIQH